MASTATASIYDTITNQIIAALERGTGDYTFPWHRSSAPLTRPINAVTRKAYRGVNVLALWASAEAQDFGHGLWATYRQWQSLGAQVRKGEKASPIVFYKILDKAEGSDDEARESAGRIFAQGSHVFNIAQVEGYALPEVPEAEAFDPISDVETFIAATGAAIRIQGESAHYIPSTDTITMPDRERFFATDTASAVQRRSCPCSDGNGGSVLLVKARRLTRQAARLSTKQCSLCQSRKTGSGSNRAAGRSVAFSNGWK